MTYERIKNKEVNVDFIHVYDGDHLVKRYIWNIPSKSWIDVTSILTHNFDLSMYTFLYNLTEDEFFMELL